MPKHLPTFKHLLHSSQQVQRTDTKSEKSVNDLLSSSRNARPRDVPPHLNGTSTNERVWAPSPIASTCGTSGIGGLVEVENGGVHPAEILRRNNIAHRQASRSVAGPAPPPSWRPSQSSSSTTDIAPGHAHATRSPQPITTWQLKLSTSLLSNSPITQSNTLVEHCLRTVLRYLEDDQPILYSPEEGNSDEPEESYTLGEILREQIPYLSLHLRSSLLHTASLLPSTSQHRLSDKSILAISSDPPPDRPGLTFGDGLRESDKQNQDDGIGIGNDWDAPSISEPTLTHLSLTLHSSPQSILPRIPNLSSITSLNLGYSTLPSDLDRLVSVLPAGLRELSLVGTTFGGKVISEDGLRRGFGTLGRKLIVLKILDLSFPRFELTPKILEGLLLPGKTKLPSLRVLGLRGLKEDGANLERSVVDGITKCDHGGTDCIQGVNKMKKEVVELLRNSGRSKYVESIW
ncbi:hypothetical protein L486_04478 [Kwoniella mangroviensis CBS 10435]|uniref:Uncharacterized protein n=1 Tax=Kwoniella mangroviensis CBS 10435 TaxID=1331196 RepID=A0A1B9ISE6_9TREE|nr:hypothetical protein L486_04478 [Kwoniella mangroviensis CBS 10435]OCF78453.1 hypothetical protein I204_00393 [Kwoniella mangroviensis CBS 8886]